MGRGRITVGFAALTLAAVVGLAWALSREAGERAGGSRRASAPQAAMMAEETRPPEVVAVTRAPVVGEEAREPALAEAQEDLVVVVGRCVDAESRPLVDVVARVSWGGDVRQPGAFVRDLDARDGEFRLELRPEPGARCTLRVQPRGFEAYGQSWSELEPGTRIDLGELRFVGLATVTGRVVDQFGLARKGERWNVDVRTRHGRSLEVRTDPRTGEFVAEDVDPGHVTVKASRDATRVAGGGVAGRVGPSLWRGDVGPGGALDVTLEYDGPRPLDEVVLRTNGPLPVDPTAVTLVSSLGAVSYGEPDEDGRELRFSSVATLPHELHVADPRFIEVDYSDVWPGDECKVTLIGIATIEVAVFDAHGAPVEEFEGRVVRLVETEAGPPTSEWVVSTSARSMSSGEPLWPAGVTSKAGTRKNDRLLPGDYRVTITPAGGGPHDRVVRDLAPGETRQVEVRLEPRGAVTGHVVGEGGGRLERAEAVLVPVDTGDARSRRRRAKVRADGRFRFPDVRAGTYELRAQRHPVSSEQRTITVVGVEEVDAGTFTVGLAGTVRARITDVPEGGSGRPLYLGFAPIHAPSSVHPAPGLGLRSPTDSQWVGRDGVVEKELAPGRWRATLGEAGHAGPWEPLGRVVLGEVEVVAGETTEVTWDLTQVGPGRVDVEVRGLPLGYGLELELTGPREVRTSGIAGTLSVGFVPAGTYRLEIRARSGLWAYADPTPLVVGRGEHVKHSIELPGARGFPHFVDERGDPLAHTPLDWGYHSGAGDWRTSRVRLDGEGKADLHVLPGTYRVRRRATAESEPGPWVELPWTEGGPAFATTEVPSGG